MGEKRGLEGKKIIDVMCSDKICGFGKIGCDMNLQTL